MSECDKEQEMIVNQVVERTLKEKPSQIKFKTIQFYVEIFVFFFKLALFPAKNNLWEIICSQ